MSAPTLAILSSLMDPSFGIPTDVTFQIMSCTPNGDPDCEKKKETVVGEVKGHKVVLGLFSPVFKTEFFGTLQETRSDIPVRETTLEAFQRMFDYIYQKEIDWSQLTVLELYDVVNLAEKYDVVGLMELMKNEMTKIPLTLECVVEVADTAVQFSQFPDISTSLLPIFC